MDIDPLSHPQQNAEVLSYPSTSQPMVKEQRDCQRLHNEPTPSTSILEDTPVAEEQYKKSGLADTLHGTTYQLKFLVLCFLKGLNYKDFRLGAEADKAHKFDDSFIKYKDIDGKTIHKFFQCKSKKDKCQLISASDLLGKRADQFDLVKYFKSYYQIRKSDEFSYNDKNEYILCTNVNFDSDNLNKDGVQLVSKVSDDPILKTAGENNLFTLKLDKSVSKISNFIELLKFDIIVRPSMIDSFTTLKSGNTLSVIPNIPAHYHKTLVEEIWEFMNIDETCCIRFKEDFLNSKSGLSKDAENIKQVLLNVLKLTYTQFKDKFKTKSFRVSHFFFNYYVYSYIEQFKSNTDNDFEQLYNLIFECVHNSTSSVIQINSTDPIIQRQMEIVARYIFVKKEKYHKLNRNLLDTNVKVPTYLNPLISKLKGYKEDIFNYDFNVSNFHVFFEEYFIEEFFKNFIWMVNLTEEKIDKEIETLSGKQINHIKSNMVANCLLSRIIEWIKEPKGTYLSMEQFHSLIDTINNDISTISVTKGLSSDFERKLENFKMVYKEIDFKLKCFLENGYQNIQVFNLICSNLTLASIQVLQALKYRQEDGYVFVSSQTLCRNTQKIFKTFQRKGYVKFLIIILNTEFDFVLYSQLFNILTSAMDKKIIFVSQSKIFDNPSINVENNYTLKIEEANITVSINNLDKQTIKRMLDKSLSLQGNEVCLKELMGQDENIDLSLKYQQEFFYCFLENEKYFLNLFHETLSLGDHLPKLNEISSCYIRRRFKIDGLQKETSNIVSKSVFVYSGCSVEDTNASVPPDSQVLHYSDYQNTNITQNITYFVVPDARYTEKFIKDLKGDLFYQLYSICHFNATKNDEKAIKFEIKEISHHEEVSLEEMTSKKVVLLIDVAGMGKTTVLSNICKSLKKQHPNNWVIRLDLNQLSEIFYKHRENVSIRNTEEAVLFLINEVLIFQNYLSNDLENEVLRYACLFHGNVVLILDGIDEVCPQYMNFILKWIHLLMQSKISKILLTSRPHLHSELTASFDPFILKLENFSRNDQLNFLIEYWTHALKSNNESAYYIEKYACTLLDVFSDTIHDWELEFSGIPLQTRLLAEVMLDSTENEHQNWLGCRQYVQQNGTVEDQIPILNLNFLYSNFIKKKVNIFVNDKLMFRTSAALDMNQEIYEKCLKQHRFLALKTVLSEEEFHMLFDNANVNDLIETIRQHKEKRGLITSINGGVPVFIHRTIAEYLVADYVINSSCHSEEFYNFIHSNILEGEMFRLGRYYVTRKFLNMALEGAEKKYAFADNSSKSVSSIALRYSNNERLRNSRSFFKALDEGHTNIMLALLSCIGEIELCRKILTKEFRSNHLYLADIIFYKANKKTVKLLVELLIPDSLRNISQSSQDSVPDLTLALFKWFYNVIKEGRRKDETNIIRNDYIHSSIISGAKNILGWLLLSADSGGCGGEVNIKNNMGQVPLHVAVVFRRPLIVKWLLTPVEENGAAADPDIKDSKGRTALELAEYEYARNNDNALIQADYSEIINALKSHI